MDVADGTVVLLRYTLTDEAGAVLEKTGDEPLAYLHGRGNVVKGLEQALAGKRAGEAFDVVVPPELGYGARTTPGPQAVPRKEFRKDLVLRAGMPVRVQGAGGESVVLWITKVAGSRVYVDVDHPLAGRTLRFTGEVVAVREPTPDELAHGHAHGAHGHGGH